MFALRLALIIQVLRAIVVPETSEELVLRYESGGENKFFARFEETRNAQTGSSDSCLFAFLRERLECPGYVPTLVPDLPRASPGTELVLRQLLTALPIYLLQGKLDPQSSHRASSNALIVLDDLRSMNNVSSNLNYLCNSKCVILVIIGIGFKKESNFLDDAELWAKALWDRKVGNAVMLFRVNDVYFMAKSRYFKANVECEPSTPTSMGPCVQGSWDNWKEFDATLFLNNCIALAAFFVEEPYVINSNDSDGITDGIEGDLMDIIADHLHIHLIGQEVTWTNDSDYQRVLEEELGNHDIIFGGLIWSPTEFIDYTIPYEVLPIIWLLPVTPHVSFRGLITPFNVQVWFAIISVSIVAIIMRILALREISLLEVFSLVLGHAWPRQPQKLSTRVQFISWVIFGFILTQCYLASLAGQLINDSHQQIETIEDLIESEFELGGSPLMKQLIAENDPNAEVSEVMKKLSEHFIIFEYDEYHDKLQDLIQGKNKSLVLAVLLNVSSQLPNYDESIVNVLDEPLGSFPFAFAVRAGLPYLEEIDKTIINIREGGLLNHLQRRYAPSNGESNNDHKDSGTVGIKQLLPGYLLIAAGYSLGIIVLLVEILVAKYGKWRAKKRK